MRNIDSLWIGRDSSSIKRPIPTSNLQFLTASGVRHNVTESVAYLYNIEAHADYMFGRRAVIPRSAEALERVVEVPHAEVMAAKVIVSSPAHKKNNQKPSCRFRCNDCKLKQRR